MAGGTWQLWFSSRSQVRQMTRLLRACNPIGKRDCTKSCSVSQYPQLRGTERMNEWMTIGTEENISSEYSKEHLLRFSHYPLSQEWFRGQLMSMVFFTLLLKTRVTIAYSVPGTVSIGASCASWIFSVPLSHPGPGSLEPALPTPAACALPHFFILLRVPHPSMEEQKRRATYSPGKLGFWLWFSSSCYHLLNISLSSSLADCVKFLWVVEKSLSSLVEMCFLI